MRKKVFDAVCLGTVVADVVTSPMPAIPEQGYVRQVNDITIHLGGCASNSAVGLARQGFKTAVVGKVGEDAFGSYILKLLEKEQVDTRWLGLSRRSATSICLILLVEGEDRRFIRNGGASDDLYPRDIPDEAISSAKVFCFTSYLAMEGLLGKEAEAILRRAKEAGAITLLDVAVAEGREPPEGVLSCLRFADYFVPNETEAYSLTGRKSPEEQAKAFLDMGAGTVVIKMGEKGALLLGEGEKIFLPAFRGKSVDPTGAGDAFAAGFIRGLIEGKDHLMCLRYGSALGFSAVRSIGATTGVFSRSELDRFLEQTR